MIENRRIRNNKANPQEEMKNTGNGVNSVQSLTGVRLFVTPWTATHQASLSFTVSQTLLRSTSIELVMVPNLTVSSSVIPFSFCPQSFPASGSFPMSQLFASGGQIIGASASASVLPVNI